MNFLILILFLCFFIFLYVVYFLSHDDFVILRADVQMEKIFNAAFLFGFSALFFSRIIYVVSNPEPIFFSLLGFILFPYFPGLSLMGGILGGFGFSYIYFKSRFLPLGRLMDFFSMAFVSSFPVGLIGALVLSQQNLSWSFTAPIIFSLIYLFIFIRFVLPFTLNSKLKDGTLCLIFFSSFPLLNIAIRTITANMRFILDLESVLSFSLFIASFAILLKQEKLVELAAEKWKNRK